MTKLVLLFASAGPVLNLCMLDDTQIEDVILSKAWYADEHATRHSLTNLLAFIASLDRQAGSPSPGSTTEYSEAVENELRRIILVEHRQRASALECEDSALTTALILLLRMRGSLQAGLCHYQELQPILLCLMLKSACHDNVQAMTYQRSVTRRSSNFGSWDLQKASFSSCIKLCEMLFRRHELSCWICWQARQTILSRPCPA